jgi:hypothetical protein
MQNINEYKKRFYNLLESKVGDVKPLISEQSKHRTWYSNASAELLKAMSGADLTGTGENKVKEILNQVNTREEWDKLVLTYRSPDGDNLTQWLKDDLSDHDKFMTSFYKRIDTPKSTNPQQQPIKQETPKTNALVQNYLYWKNMFSNNAEELFNYLFKKERLETPMIPYSDFANSCATKVSLALNATGMSDKVKRSFTVTSGEAAGQPVTTSAKGLRDHLMGSWGKKPVVMKGSVTEEELINNIGKGKSGVFICSPCGFASCSGHAFVWSPSAGTNKQGGAADDSSYHINNPSAELYFFEYTGA